MSTAPVTLRSCARDDATAVLSLWERAAGAHNLPDTLDVVLRRLERDPELFVVATCDGAIVGTLIGGWDGWRGNMYRLAVDPPFRRRGIGRALVREVEERFRAKGAVRITALVLKDEAGAAEFWTAVGYGADDTIQRHVRNL